MVAATTLALILVLERTRLGALGLFVAVVLASAAVAALPGLEVPTMRGPAARRRP